MAQTSKHRIAEQFDDEGEEYALEPYDLDELALEDEVWRRGEMELYDPDLGINNPDNILEETRKDSFFGDLHASQFELDSEEEEGDETA